MNKKVLALVLLAFVGVAALVEGCAKVQQISGNAGTISGYVYCGATYNSSTKTYSGTAEATIMAGGKTATADSSGYFTLNGVPAGEIAVTAFKNGYASQTIVADNGTISFILSPQRNYSNSSSSGAATLSGTLTGVPGSLSVYGTAYSKNKYSSNLSYNSTTQTYTMTGAPDEGEVYVAVYYSTYEAGSYINKFAYGKTSANPGETKTLNISFGDYRSLSGSISLPSGFTASWLPASLYKGYQYRGPLSSASNPTSTYQINYLPPLESGDSYSIAVYASNSGGDQISKRYYNITGTTQDVDLSSLTLPTPASPSPSDGANLAGAPPSFAWDKVAGENIVYQISLYEYSTSESKSIWSVWTRNNSIAFPSGLIGSGALESGKTYRWSINTGSYSPAIEFNDVAAFIKNIPDDFHTNYSSSCKVRSFVF
ncbi:carboxypeptidase regulatory-like domain-containing protein [Candidatus Saganbacteria bacterium]|nr:carboxypeptidase regulatory-like domain-containing protein [Candidatus Saganbacteria bacterium]